METINYNIAEKYISNIPWNEKYAFELIVDNDKYFEAFNTVFQVVPEVVQKVDFSDMIWNFNYYFEDINSRKYVINFESANEDLVNYLKFYSIYLMSKKKKISTINSCLYCITKATKIAIEKS